MISTDHCFQVPTALRDFHVYWKLETLYWAENHDKFAVGERMLLFLLFCFFICAFLSVEDDNPRRVN